MTNRARITAVRLLAIGGALTGLGAAQAAAQTQPPAEEDFVDSNDIIVTATKRSGLSIQDIPASVVALSGEQLEERGIDDVRSLATQTPGVVFSDFTGTTYLTIRGIGISVATGTAEPSVASYVDGVLLPRPTMAKLQLIDLERLEILKGPQGTLYGRNATAGAVNYVSVKPTEDFRAGLNLGIGNYDQRLVSGFVNGKLTDGVAARLSATREVQDGYIRNLFNGDRYANVDFWSVRGSLRFTPSEDLTIDLSAQHQRSEAADAVQQQFQYTAPLPPGVQGSTVPNRIFVDRPAEGLNTLTVLSGTVNWKLNDNLTLQSVTGYVKHNSDVSYDADTTTAARVNLEHFRRPSESYSEELNLIGSAGPLKYVLGAYYYHERFIAEVPVLFPTGAGAANPPGAVNFRRIDSDIDAYALFADVSLSLTDRFRVNVGGRYTSEKNNVLQTSGTLLPDGSFVGSLDVPDKIKSSRFLPKVGVDFDVAPNVLVYAQFQEGFKAPGPNIGIINLPFKPESLQAYEGGIKSHFLNKRVTANVAVFHYDYENFQVTNTPPGTLVSQVVNAQAKVTGVEGEIRIIPSDYFELNLAASYVDGRYVDFFGIDSFQPALGAQDLSGNELDRVPPITVNAGFGFRIPADLGPFNEVRLRVDAAYNASYYMRLFNLPQDRQDAFVNLDASLTLASDGPLSVRIYGKNLTNQIVRQQSGFSSLTGGFLTGYGPPRRYGATVSLRF